MESFFSRYRNALVLITVLLVQVIGLAVQARRPSPDAADSESVSLIRYWVVSVITPPERWVHAIADGIGGIWSNYVNLVHVKHQNRELQMEMDRLRLEQAGLAEDARQAQRLQGLLGFTRKYIYKTVVAQVIGTSGSDQSRIVYIDKGSEDGIRAGMPVITPDGIVGKTRDVFPHKSQVLQISDPTSGAGVVLETTRIRGILRGNVYGQPQVINVMPDDRIKPGEKVITSGGDQLFPRGLPVGVVDRVEIDPEHDPLVDILIKPAANLAQLEEVLVITNMGDQLPPQAVHDIATSELQVEQQRASDILAERLPSRIDPNAPEAAENLKELDASGEVARPLAPPAALHPDHFSPNATPPATTLVPGQRIAPLLADQPGTTNPVRKKPDATTATGNAQGGAQGTGATTQANSATGTAAPVRKKPEIVPDFGNKPPPPTVTAAGDISPVTPRRSTLVTEPKENGAAPQSPSENTPGATPENGRPANSENGRPTNPVKTTVVVDGPERSAKPASNAGSTAPRSNTVPGAATQPSDTAPKKSGPEIVPSDGSYPPGYVPPKKKPQAKPATKPNQTTQPATPPAQQPPQGRRN